VHQMMSLASPPIWNPTDPAARL